MKNTIENIPNGWKIARLIDIAKPIKDTVGERRLETLSISAGIGFVNQANKFGKELSGKQYVHYTVIQRGDFSFNKGNSRRYPYGCIYKLRDRDIAAVPNAFYSFRIEGQCTDYFEELFKSGYLNSQLKRLINTGVRDDGLFNLYEEDFYNCTVLMPTLDEQKKIAEILMMQDNVIALKEKLLEAKKKQKKGLMQNLLTGRIRLMGFNGHWRQDRLGSYFTERIETNCQELNLLSVTGEKGIIPRTEIKHKDNSSEDKSKYLKVHIGDIAYNTMRMWQGVSAISAFEGIVSPAYTVLAPVEGANSLFFSYLFKLKHMINIFYRNSQGLVDDQRSLKFHNFARIKVSVPTFLEQTAIAKHLATVDNEIELLTKDLESQKNLKKYLMQQLLTGKIRV